MEHFTFTFEDEKTIKFSGALDEYASIKKAIESFPKEVWVDLSEVTTINSMGVREWSLAIASSSSKIHYINCPSIVIDQFNATYEFLGENATIDSMEVYFHCELCDYTTSHNCEVGQGKEIDLTKEDFLDHLPPDCLRCGEKMQIDHQVEIYFQLFLKNP